MKTTISALLAAALIAGACPVGASASPAKPASTAAIRVEAPWVRAAPPGTPMLAGYMTLHNDGRTAVTLVGADSDAFGDVTLHQTMAMHGVTGMRPAGEQAIPAGGMLRIAPGGLHLMLMEPKRALKPGDTVRFHLHFDKAPDRDVDAAVLAEPPPPR